MHTTLFDMFARVETARAYTRAAFRFGLTAEQPQMHFAIEDCTTGVCRLIGAGSLFGVETARVSAGRRQWSRPEHGFCRTP